MQNDKIKNNNFLAHVRRASTRAPAGDIPTAIRGWQKKNNVSKGFIVGYGNEMENHHYASASKEDYDPQARGMNGFVTDLCVPWRKRQLLLKSDALAEGTRCV